MKKKLSKTRPPAPRRKTSRPAAAKSGSMAPSAASFTAPEHEHSLGSVLVKPEILAPAGDMPAALTALAAGADALYVGLKHFSARMQAENFATRDLAGLTELAHAEGRRIYVAMNTLVKPSEPAQAYRLIRRLAANVNPDALIVQDPAFLDLARQAGFSGELHLSTLANATHPQALQTALALGVKRVIMPRELSLDELRLMNAACPDGLDLEMFVHGALCYCVSGRCWWSSYMGGKSGLRGRCVQPCRRVYAQKGRKGRFFSCMDLSLDVLTRNLLALERMTSWKIEGRKKSPHYVYHVATAYRLLRDEPDNPGIRKDAEDLLAMALGRPFTRALFLDLKTEQGAVSFTRDAQTSSGLLCGKIVKNDEGLFCIRPRLALLAKDYLRIGYEDEPWHATLPVAAFVPQGQEYALPLPRNKFPKAGTPVFLIDRKEPELTSLLNAWEQKLRRHAATLKAPRNVSGEEPRMPAPCKGQGGRKMLDIRLRGFLPQGKEGKEGIRPGAVQGLWLSPRALKDISKTLFSRISWWLPPVIWPEEEAGWKRLIAAALRNGARHFVCNSPWQAAFFSGRKEVSLTAGPFCNIANASALGILARLGFAAAVISPELGAEDILSLPGQSPLPLGIVLDGYWPAGISRHRTGPLKQQEGLQSPKGEEFWLRRYGQNLWIYPAWPLDLSARRNSLERAGYGIFVHMDEHPPQSLGTPKRSSEFNWAIDVL